jgi:D-alanyl-D-alanine carboxypeptidase/D-alanyl-D-alanine-endopeptidase (penicillin-binding protein 4)
LRPVSSPKNWHKRLHPGVEELIAKSNLNATVGMCVADAQTGQVLESTAGDAALPPASVAKALTACYALETLGKDYRFETRLLTTGPISDGVVQGDLILVGGGDPELNTDDLAVLASDLSKAGVTAVTGAFKVWGAELPKLAEIDRKQPAQVGYNPAISGLNLNFNRVHFEWRKQGANYAVTMEARSERHRPAVSMSRMQVKPRSTPIYTYADLNGRDHWTVARAALGNGGSRWLPIRKPDLYAGEVFQTLARANGIKLAKPEIAQTAPDGQTIATFQGAPLRDVLQRMLKYSTNLTAEVVGLTASRVRSGAVPTDLVGSAALMNAWLQETFDLRDVRLVDHSGLGDASRIAPQDMMRALQMLRQRVEIKALMKPFHMRDANRKIIKDHPISVSAKTGTLNFVSGLAGFVDLPDGRELVFAIFAADMPRRAGLSKAERENPPGAKSWNIRAKTLQQHLIERWGVVYAA